MIENERTPMWLRYIDLIKKIQSSIKTSSGDISQYIIIY